MSKMSYTFCLTIFWTLCSSLLFVSTVQGSNNTSINSNCSANASTMSTNYSQCLEEPYLSCPDPSLCEITNSGDNVGLAFGLTIGAGLSTTLGALLPFVPCVKRSNTLYLAAGLALAAGVMLYVSFTEIWTKAKWNFCCESPEHFDLLTTVCFFVGILITLILDVLVSLLQKIDCGFSCCHRHRGQSTKNTEHQISVKNPFRRSLNVKSPIDSSIASDTSQPSVSLDENLCNQVTPSNYDAVSHEPSIGTCTSMLPSNGDQVGMETVSMSVQSNVVSESTNNCIGVSPHELLSESSLLRMRAVVPEMSGDSAIDMGEDGGSSVSGGTSVSVEGGLVRRASYLEMVDQAHDSVEPLGPEEFKAVTEGLGKDAKKLHKMGILTGLAVAIHNFPEGLATFVATLADPSLGVALCIAIALHNIPEGVCVAMPVYYATGKRWKGFLWAFLSGISEPIGALLGWLVLKDVFGPLVYGISFGLISGMMVFIALKELLPTARRFDTTGGHLVNGFLIAGMVVMAISLILFLY